MTPPDPLAPPPATDEDWIRFRAAWRALLCPFVVKRVDDARERAERLAARGRGEAAYAPPEGERPVAPLVRQEVAPQAPVQEPQAALPEIVAAVKSAIAPDMAALALAVALKAQQQRGVVR